MIHPNLVLKYMTHVMKYMTYVMKYMLHAMKYMTHVMKYMIYRRYDIISYVGSLAKNEALHVSLPTSVTAPLDTLQSE
jgi:hypothetical protein